MSKEELNNGAFNSEAEIILAGSDQNTQQNTESNLIQENEEIDQSQIKTDHRINEESLAESQNSNLISGDLTSVNKPDDSRSVNENSALHIEESANSNTTNDTNCETEVKDSTEKALPTVKSDGRSDSNSGQISRSQSPEDQTKPDIEKLDENITDSSGIVSEVIVDDKDDDATDVNKHEIKRTSFCVDSGAYLSKSEKQEDIDKNSEESPNANIPLNNDTDAHEAQNALETESDVNQTVSETRSDLKSNDDIVKEEEKDTSKLSEENVDIIDRVDEAETTNAPYVETNENAEIDTENKVTEETQDNNQTDKSEAENYEDDFEETIEEPSTEGKNLINTDTVKDEKENKPKDTESVEKISDLKNETEKTETSEVTSKKEDNTPAESEQVSNNTVISDNVTEENTVCESNTSEIKSEEGSEVKSSVNETESHKEIEDNTNSDNEKSDEKFVTAVNENNEEKELTEVVIDEDGIPKVAITTVPDRPPSSLNDDTVDQSDPFEDFGSDTDANDKNKSDSKEKEVTNQETSKEEQLSKENKMSEKVDMENDQKNESNVQMEDSNESGGTKVEANTELNKNETQADSKDENTRNETDPKSNESENTKDKDIEKENTETSKTEEKPKSQEPVTTPQQESPLEQMLKRNVQIDGTVESLPKLEETVTTLLNSMKDVMKYYSDLLKLQALKDFTNDLGKFRGDFISITDAFKICNSMSTNLNQHLKELRLVTDEVRSQINRKFQQEDLKTWVDVPIEKEKEKEKLEEEIYAAEKAAMANAAEARQIVSKATVGVSDAHKLIAEMEVQMTDAQAIAQKAEIQARVALIAAEEARVAAEERRRAEEAAKARAEERAKIKAAEDEKKKAMEEMKIHQEAAAKGTSIEDERKRFTEEKARKEQERKNPKHWPRFTFETEGVDFKPVVACVIRAIEGSMRKTDVTCSYVDQSEGILTLGPTEELVSNIIRVTQTEEDRYLNFEEPLSVALPVCIGRVPTGKETVVKQKMSNGAWRELPSADVQFEDFRELKFVEGRCIKFGTFVVVLRPKKDMLQFLKKGCKLLCSSDFRISLSCKPGTFKQNMNAVLEVQTYDSNVIHDLKTRFPKECEDLLTASPFVKFSIPVKNFEKPLTVTLPLPQTQTRQKRPATGITRETKPTQDIRPSTARPTTTNEEDAQEQIFFLHRDEKSGWTVNSKINLVQPKLKDTVVFDIPTSYERMLLLRTKAGKRDAAVEKMATLLESMATQRNVKLIVRQRNDDVADVMVSCAISKRADRTLKYMEDNAFTEGPNPSPDILLKEGQQLFVKFRGNVECVSKNPSLSFIYNTNIRATREFKINEKEEFAQKSLPSYRGFVQIFTKALVPSPQPEGAPKNVQPEMVEAEVLLAELLVELPKPEAEPPKPLTTAPLHLKEGPLTNGVLRLIAGMIGKEWKEVAAQLNLKPMRIQAILRNHLNKNTAETRFDMLVTWAKRVPKSVDKVQILCNALNACGRADVAEEVRQKGQQYKQQRFMSARVSHLRQAFVKVAKTTAVFNKWKNFAKDLGVSEEKIKEIDESGGSGQEKCYTSLETWKDAEGETATVTTLATFLKSAKQERLSRDLETMVAT